VLLTWDDKGVEVLSGTRIEEHLQDAQYRLAEGPAGHRGRYRDRVTRGVALLRALADTAGLTAGLSKALATDRLLVHDRGRVLADLACAIADGAEVISDFRVMGDQQELSGLVASAGASHALISRLDKLAARRGYQLIYSVGWELGGREKAAIAAVPAQAWQIAVDERGEVRERRAEGACGDPGCGHRQCWIEEAHVT
jgi:hypothetical protein